MNVASIALNTALKPIYEFLEPDNVTEVSINQECEVFVEKDGIITCYEAPELTNKKLSALATLIASFNGQSINEKTPLLSGSLPDSCRVQIVTAPCVETNKICFSIRKPTVKAFTLDDYEKSGAFENIIISKDKGLSKDDKELIQLLKDNKKAIFLRKCIEYKKNIIISGGTSTGKTTFANALIKLINHDERLITIEDTRETKLDQPNKVHLLASKGEQGTAKVTVQDLLESCLRLRPDRLLLSELRGSEAFSYLRAVNTGHPGSITTLHADTPAGAYEQLNLMVTQAGLGLSRKEILEYIHSVVEVVIQLKKVNGKRVISEIYFEHY